MGTSQLDLTGLTIESLTSIVSDLTTGMKSIYGQSINVNSNSPDGQFINIMAQELIDLLELVQAVYASFSVNTAYGTQLDNRLAINGMERVQGTYTQAYVQITATQALTLYGLDQSVHTVFTVADATGNQYELVTTYAFTVAGTQTLLFQSVAIGQVETSPNTIQTAITSILGITTVNNSTTANDTTGINEETDAQFRLRQQQMFALASTGPADSVEAALLQTTGVTDAIVIENYTTSGIVSGAYTVPAHSIWCIVNGAATAAAIGAAIYAKKGDGCGMYGALFYTVTRPNGTTFVAAWDAAIAESLYIKFSLAWKGATALDNATIIKNMALALNYKLGQNPSVGDIQAALSVIAPTAVALFGTGKGVSGDNATFGSIAYPTAYLNYYTVAAANISII